MAVVTPWAEDSETKMLISPETEQVVALLGSEVLVTVLSCNGSWCRITVEGHEGYVAQDRLWGVYPGEIVE